MKETNRREFLETLIGIAVAAGCDRGSNSKSNPALPHSHKSQLYTAGVYTQEEALAAEKVGGNFLPYPFVCLPELLKEHIGEWSIAQNEYVSRNEELSGNILPYMDGCPKTAKLYQPLAYHLDKTVPRLLISNKNPDYRGTRELVPVYNNIEEARRDISRIEGRLIQYRHPREPKYLFGSSADIS